MRSEWYTMVDDERGTLKLEFNRRAVFLHLSLWKPMDGLRAVRAYFPYLKAVLRNLGYRFVHVIIPEGDDKLRRFETWLGFTELVRVPAKRQIVMRQEC